MQLRRTLLYAYLSISIIALFPRPAWSGYCLHKASPVLYWGTIPGEAEMIRLKEMGIKTLINVRTNSLKGHQRMARRLGLKFVHIKTGVVLTPQEPELRKFLELVCDPESRPVYIFCTLGTDRTCYYVAAYRLAIDGWTVHQAAAELDVHGLKHWWPTFREYDDALRSNEELIHRLADNWKGPAVARTPATTVEPCINIMGKKKPWNQNSARSIAAKITLGVLCSPLEGIYKGVVAVRGKKANQSHPDQFEANDQANQSLVVPVGRPYN